MWLRVKFMTPPLKISWKVCQCISRAMLNICICRCAVWLQWNHLCLRTNFQWKNPHHGGCHQWSRPSRHYSQVLRINNVRSPWYISSSGSLMTSSTTYIQWRRTLSSTSSVPISRSIWTNVETSLIVSAITIQDRVQLFSLQLPKSTWLFMRTRIGQFTSRSEHT